MSEETAISARSAAKAEAIRLQGSRAALSAHRQAVRRFAHHFAELPVETQATCPRCGQVTPAVFERAGSQVVLNYHCDACGDYREAHFDAIWTNAASDYPGSATHTHHGSRIHPVIRRLPKTVETLCPDCAAMIVGRYFVEHGAVYIEKTCPEHGYFRDCINTDARLFAKAAWWSYEEHPGLENPQVTGASRCPSECGLCNQHLSGSVLAQIDLTNRCNMRCPVCFANAGSAGYVFEPDFDQVVKQLQTLRDIRPIPCTAIQFTGGEPTIHPDFLRIVAKAREMGFSHIQIATNGIKLADADFASQCLDAGLHTLYLQFDGVGEAPYRTTRNYPGIWEKKLAVIDNCRRLGMKICLVPTILKGVNDEQVPEIFRFAVQNIDVISAISYQPVSFTGRIDAKELAARRYTLGDLAHGIAEASGASPLRDMFPLSIVVPLSQILEAVTGQPKIRPTCHPDCAFGTYFFVSPEGKAYAFPQVIDVEGMFVEMNRLAARIRSRGRAVWTDRIRLLRLFKRHFRHQTAPPDLSAKRFIRSIKGMLDKSAGRGQAGEQSYRTLLCAGMHFQDRYNFDVERAKRCVILYSTPAGVFPFCTYNCGPEYRAVAEPSCSREQLSQQEGSHRRTQITEPESENHR